jgi:ATP-dependent helicase HrpB
VNESRPPVTGLPVEEVIPALRRALAGDGHAVLVAPPGSGKTTIVPLHLTDEPWLGGRRIVMLEPRRLATRAAARRMAQLLGEEPGETVGFVTRTDRQTGPGVSVEVVTEGVLTRRLQRDPELSNTGLVIFDELHERNLQTDLGLALALHSRALFRPDLRLLVMSATIDAHRIAALIGGEHPAPVIESAARQHPVDIRWAPLPRTARLESHAATVIRQAMAIEEGDALVFLPGIGEINRVAEHLAAGDIGADVRRLHGSLSVAEQDLALAPSLPGTRKVVLSTDIAESSLTVEGVRIVVDSGLARAPRFDVRTGMSRLTTVPISKASADQRSGRAGRIEPGVAYRLWSKIEQGARKAHIQPEITQVDLAGLALELFAWGVESPDELRWLDPPPRRTFDEAVSLLRDLGAVSDGRALTDVGRAMVDLPLHPRLAHMVVAAGVHRGLACVMAALVDDRDIMRGDWNELPVDLTLRVRAVAGMSTAVDVDRRGLDRVRRAAEDIARRAGVSRGLDVDPEAAGAVLALAFPDRLAYRRGSPGRFQLRTGTTAWIPPSDPLASEQFLVVADLDGKRKDARIRLAAPLDSAAVAETYDEQLDHQESLVWEGDRIVERIETRIGGITLATRERRASPSDRVVRMILDRVRADLELLPWTDAARSLAARVAFLSERSGDPWPDWSASGLRSTVGDWLAPSLTAATGLDDVRSLDLSSILRSVLGHPLAVDVDLRAPRRIRVPSGREVEVDYSDGRPRLSVRVQEMFGSSATPEVGGEPVVMELLSPARRPIQITNDLAGFWEGSWRQVRKEMAGRYPKHDWPENPATASPSSR